MPNNRNHHRISRGWHVRGRHHAGRDGGYEGGPFPLVVLSHGLGGSPASLVPLASRWASRGYVVALPAFPLTNSKTPGGAAQQDTQNQPGDVSFLIDEVLAESASAGLLLSDAVDGEKIAASGHSNGGLTTYGVAVNSCCRDQRVGAAIILSGVPAPYAGGDYDPSIAPANPCRAWRQ
ncbi:MAG: hypothetical protein IPG64_14865 [Haliea sp.]|nr:hypothetical protein [Haliea sp.]